MLRRMWTPSGFQPVATVNWEFEWLWLYGFVHPESGETYWWILPYVNFKLFNRVLADLAHEFGLGKDKHVILPVERAALAHIAIVKALKTLGVRHTPLHLVNSQTEQVSCGCDFLTKTNSALLG